MNLKNLLLFTCIAVAPALALADDRPEHYPGEEAATLREALENLHEYSGQLAAIIQDDDFGIERLHAVHEITYTLENALQTLEKELQQLAETLESVHIASERGETNTVVDDSRMFLENTRVLLQQMPRE